MNQRIPHHRLIQSRTRTAAGFTIMEVLIAMGIFVVGMVGIAAVFPVAISLQQATTREIQGVQAQRNTEALLMAVGVDPLDLYATYPPAALPSPARATDIRPLHTTFFDEWSLADRSYPRSLSPAAQAEFYWVPLCQDLDGIILSPADTGDTVIHLFILARQQNAVYELPSSVSCANPSTDLDTVPKVVSTPAVKKLGATSVISLTSITNAKKLFKPGDQVLDNNGSPHTISEVRDDEITVTGILSAIPPADPGGIHTLWYARPANVAGDPDELVGPNPTVAIIQLSNLVQP